MILKVVTKYSPDVYGFRKRRREIWGSNVT